MDDHAQVRSGLRGLLEVERDLEVVAEASCAREVSQMVERSRPDVVVLDVRLPDGNGVELCRSIQENSPETACVILTAFMEADVALAALLAGASGFVLKQIRGGDLVSCIRLAALGGKCTDPAVLQRARGAIEYSDHFGLDETERSVALQTVEGHTDAQIASSLGISISAVTTSRSVSFDKVRSRAAS